MTRYSKSERERILNLSKIIVREKGLIMHLNDVANKRHLCDLILKYIIPWSLINPVLYNELNKLEGVLKKEDETSFREYRNNGKKSEKFHYVLDNILKKDEFYGIVKEYFIGNGLYEQDSS